jgi:hypothetical protein
MERQQVGAISFLKRGVGSGPEGAGGTRHGEATCGNVGD